MTKQEATKGGAKTSQGKDKRRIPIGAQWCIDFAVNRARSMLDVLVRIESAIMDEFKAEAAIVHEMGYLSDRKFDEAVHVAYLKALDEARERWGNDTTVEDVEDTMIAETESSMVRKSWGTTKRPGQRLLSRDHPLDMAEARSLISAARRGPRGE